MKNSLIKNLSKILFTAAIALAFCGASFIFGCSGNEIALVNYRWDLSLPTSEEPLYSYENKGFGDGTYYYVLSVSEDLLGINFNTAETEQEEAVTGYYSSVLESVDSQYRVDFSHDISLYYQSKNDGTDKIYLIYDGDLSRLTIFEMN